jgi:hypothetical protein
VFAPSPSPWLAWPALSAPIGPFLYSRE